jgi:glycosyltransferase involved in cell wall biosynthesis
MSSVGEANILLVAEELGQVPDEAYTKFSLVLESEIGRRRPLHMHVTRAHRWANGSALRVLSRMLEVARVARQPEVRRRPPAVVVYASRSSITLPALVRARLLGLQCHAPVAMIALQTTAEVLRGRLARWMAPDLLLLPTERECQVARDLGLRAHCIWSGVDLDRFRPPGPGEKEALRRKWGIATDRRVMLHVGHVKEGRNLRALAPLGARNDATMLVVASGQRAPESETLELELKDRGIEFLSGYQAQVEELYRLADCYVFPTASSDSAVAMPLSVLEALASDLPVVSMRFGALAERLGEAPGLELVDDAARIPERALALAGRSVMTRALVEPFSWTAIMDRLLEILDQLAQRRQVPWAGSRGPASPASDTGAHQQGAGDHPG